MNYFGTFSGENARSELQHNEVASFIYRWREEYSQAEKSRRVADRERIGEKFNELFLNETKINVRPRAR